jgi:hypothetical protein
LSISHEERSLPIIETTLSELAFILFFVLLVFTVWNSVSHNKEAEEKELDKQNLQKEVTELQNILRPLAPYIAKFDSEELVTLLEDPKTAANSLQILEEQLTTLTETNENLEKELDLIGNIVADVVPEQKEQVPLSKQLKTVVSDMNDIKGQFENLKGRVLGNGLDHPPCWADPVTGEIEFLYAAIIEENLLTVLPAWPGRRSEEAKNNINIKNVPGEYALVRDFQSATTGIYQESVEGKCRHFVRIYDKAVSKDAYKRYLLGVEYHFYKYLSREQAPI